MGFWCAALSAQSLDAAAQTAAEIGGSHGRACGGQSAGAWMLLRRPGREVIEAPSAEELVGNGTRRCLDARVGVPVELVSVSSKQKHRAEDVEVRVLHEEGVTVPTFGDTASPPRPRVVVPR